MNFVNVFRIKRNGAESFFGKKSFKPKLKAVNAPDVVAVPQTADDCADNVV